MIAFVSKWNCQCKCVNATATDKTQTQIVPQSWEKLRFDRWICVEILQLLYPASKPTFTLFICCSFFYCTFLSIKYYYSLLKLDATYINLLKNIGNDFASKNIRIFTWKMNSWIKTVLRNSWRMIHAGLQLAGKLFILNVLKCMGLLYPNNFSRFLCN